jgi:hypothetical protein
VVHAGGWRTAMSRLPLRMAFFTSPMASVRAHQHGLFHLAESPW